MCLGLGVSEIRPASLLYGAGGVLAGPWQLAERQVCARNEGEAERMTAPRTQEQLDRFANITILDLVVSNMEGVFSNRRSQAPS